MPGSADQARAIAWVQSARQRRRQRDERAPACAGHRQRVGVQRGERRRRGEQVRDAAHGRVQAAARARRSGGRRSCGRGRRRPAGRARPARRSRRRRRSPARGGRARHAAAQQVVTRERGADGLGVGVEVEQVAAQALSERRVARRLAGAVRSATALGVQPQLDDAGTVRERACCGGRSRPPTSSTPGTARAARNPSRRFGVQRCDQVEAHDPFNGAGRGTVRRALSAS